MSERWTRGWNSWVVEERKELKFLTMKFSPHGSKVSLLPCLRVTYKKKKKTKYKHSKTKPRIQVQQEIQGQKDQKRKKTIRKLR